MTSKLWPASPPAGSRAVTVTVAAPRAADSTSTALPVAHARTTAVSDDTASKVSGSPSGSLNAPDTSTVALSPTYNCRPASSPAETGARFGTVTSKLWPASPPAGSRAVTVTVAAPRAADSTSTALPVTHARTTAVSDDTASKVSGSPSGSLNAPDTSTVALSPTYNCRPASSPAETGARFGTVTSKVWPASPPAGSRAVTVTVAAPRARAMSEISPLNT